MGRLGLQFGVMCTGTTLVDWQAECVRHLLGLPDVCPALLIVDDNPTPVRATFPGRLRNPGLLWNLRARCFDGQERRIDMSSYFQNVPQVHCRTELRGRFSHYFKAGDLEEIESYDLDFILRFAFNIIRGPILEVAKYGVWSFHHGDIARYRGSPAACWEIYNRDPITGATLQRLTNKLDGGIVLKEGRFPTISKSYRRNRDNVYMSSTDFPARVCRDIRVGQAAYLDAASTKTDAPIYRKPTNRETLRFMLRQAQAFLVDKFGWLCRHEQWNIGWIEQPIESLLNEEPKEIKWLAKMRRDRFVADPFGIQFEGEILIFFEDLDYRVGNGTISAFRWAEEGPPEILPAFRAGCHVSYPFIFEHENEIYCVPEMADSKSVRLFRIRAFPDDWEEVAVLLKNVPALDPTLTQHDGRWWMFYSTTVGEGGLSLNACYADTFTGPWYPHARNPLKTDVTSARPAGTLFRHQGSLYRPAQDCGETYGGRVVLHRITRLSPIEFAEEPVSYLQPDPQGPFPAGIHTVSQVGSRILVDGKRQLFVPVLFRRELAKYARRLFLPSR